MPPQTQVNSATLVMGVTGSGKSSLLATLAKYVWARWQKKTLYYNSDGGGFPAEIQAVQALGILRVFRMLTRDPGTMGLAFETCYRSCQGWWPRRINPVSGEVEPGVEMVPPISVRYEMRCPNGHLVKDVPAEALLTPTPCPECRLMTTKQNMQVQRTVKPNKGFEDVGAVCYDGLSSMLAWGLRDLGHRAGRMELRGEEAAIGGKVVSGDLSFGGTTRSHVGFAQSRGEELVHLTLGIPNLVVPPVFTALTHEDVDERSLSIIGPKIAGRAKTDEAPQWFGNVMETAKIPALEGAGEQRILYLSEYIDTRGVRHLLKHRGSPGTMPPYLVDPVGGDENPALAFTQVNLGVFFRLLDDALAKRIEAVRLEFPDAPGLPEGMVEIGDPTIVQPKPATAAGPAPAPVAAAAAPGVLVAPGVVAPAGSPLAQAATPAPPAIVPTASAPRGRKKTATAAVPAPSQPPPAPAPAPAAAAPTTQPAPPVPAVTGAPGGTAAQPAAPAPPGSTPAAPPAASPRAAAPPAGGPRPAAPPAGRPPAAPPPGPRPVTATPGSGSPGVPPAQPPAAPNVAPGAPARPPAAAPRPAAAAPRPPAPPPRPPVK